MNKPRVFVFMGKSGSGKGTQAELLQTYLEEHDKRKVLYMNTGGAFRDLATHDTHTGRLLARVMETGDLVPVFLPVWTWTTFLVEQYTGEEHIIFDGLARREIEAPILDSALEFYGVEHVTVVHINVSDEWARERLLGRARSDDHETEINKRLAWFAENTSQALDYFRKHERGYFHDINGEQSIEAVHQDIVKALAD